MFLKSVTVVAFLLTLGLAALGLSQQVGRGGKPTPTTKPYLLDTCIMSGEKLGSMGDPDVIMYQDREIKFCCSNCEADFRKDPEKYLKKLDEAVAKAPTTKPSGG